MLYLVILLVFVIALCSNEMEKLLKQKKEAIEHLELYQAKYENIRNVLSNNDNIIGFLEQSTAPIAKRLLLASNEDWQHDVTKKVPHMEHWKLFLRDFNLEATEERKLVCLQTWMRDRTKFTEYEKVEIISRFSDPDIRQKAREQLLIPTTTA